MLLSIEFQDLKAKNAPHKKALILAFRGTEALKNANVGPLACCSSGMLLHFSRALFWGCQKLL